MPGPYDETLTAEEQDVLKQFDGSTELPPPDDSGETDPAAAAAPDPVPADPVPAADAPDPELAAFLEKHKGKSTDELAKLAFDQNKRANGDAARARTETKKVVDFQAKLAAAAARVQATRDGNEAERTRFEEQLRNDPDAATKALHDRLLGNDQQTAEQELFAAQQEAARGVFAQAVPDADRHLPAAFDFAREFNYTDEEIANISDPRDMVMLHLASITGRMVKAGLIDVQGNILMQPDGATTSTTDPRLAAKPGLQTLGSGGGRPSAAATGVDEQLQSMLSMTEDEMAALPPEKFAAIMRAAGM